MGSGKIDTVKFLVKSGADVNIGQGHYRTPRKLQNVEILAS